MTAETRRNTLQNEQLLQENVTEVLKINTLSRNRRIAVFLKPFSHFRNAWQPNLFNPGGIKGMKIAASEIPGSFGAFYHGLCIFRSPSDLEADDEDTQDVDSNTSCRRPGTPTGESTDEVKTITLSICRLPSRSFYETTLDVAFP